MINGDIITFDVKKNFTYIKPLGDGGTGDTYLFKDETTDMLFAMKKYVPKDSRYIDENYKRFVEEIKILFNISHPNIVRIYNYYLYPSMKTGYLQMEYVDGKSIVEFEEYPWGKTWNDVFNEVISAFEYLENNKILHRDIRPENILIDNKDFVKIIDFGFGKQLDIDDKSSNSILLNWPATEMPNEVIINHEYNECTEIYFVGTLFKQILRTKDCEFRFQHIIEKMTKLNPAERYASFMDIRKDITSGILSEIDFAENEKDLYLQFANVLSDHINHFLDKYSPISDNALILSKMSEIIRNSSLELYLQDNSKLISCFVSSQYNYNARKDIEMQIIIDFYRLIASSEKAKQQIILDNIFTRLSSIKVKTVDDDLPF